MTIEERRFLAGSAEFQAILAADPVLIELDRQSVDLAEERLSLFEMFRGTLQIGGLTVQPITPALWAFLWSIGNRYTTDVRLADETDTDVFMWLLTHGVRGLDCASTDLPVRAAGFCPDNGIDYVTAYTELVKMINAAFRPLAMLPSARTDENESADDRRFDAFWLAGVCAVAARESGEPARDLMFDMPLSTAYYFYVNACRENDTKNLIRRRSSAEIAEAILDRVNELGAEFCKEHFNAC